MQRIGSLLLVLVLLTGSASAQVLPQDEGSRAEAAPAVGPVKIIVLGACFHAEIEQAVARTRTAVPVEINSSTMQGCTIDFRKAKGAITALAKKLEAERAAAIRRRAPVPVTLIYLSTILEGADSIWVQAVKRLSQSAVIVAPAGNSPELMPHEVWPPAEFSLKVGNAPGGRLTNRVGKDISIYLDFGVSVEVVLDGVSWGVGNTSTSSMLTAAHLANVLSRGTGQKLTPTQLLGKLKGAFREVVIKEEDLEVRLEAVLR